MAGKLRKPTLRYINEKAVQIHRTSLFETCKHVRNDRGATASLADYHATWGDLAMGPRVLAASPEHTILQLIARDLERLALEIRSAQTRQQALAFARKREGLLLALLEWQLPGMTRENCGNRVASVRYAAPVNLPEHEHPLKIKPAAPGRIAVVAEWTRGIRFGPNLGGPASAARLTPREVQVLHLICDGMSTKEIAAELHITFKTAVSHRTHIMEKLGTRNTAALVRFAIHNDIVQA